MSSNRAHDEAIGLRIKEALGRRSQAWLAGELELDPSTINRWIKGAPISYGNLLAIARVLSCPVEQLMGGHDTPFRFGVDDGNPKPVRIGKQVLRNIYLMEGNGVDVLDLAVNYSHTPIARAPQIVRVYESIAREAKENSERDGHAYFNGPNARLRRITQANTRQLAAGPEQKGIVLEIGPVSWEEYTVLNEFLDKVVFDKSEGDTIRKRFALKDFLYENSTDLRWCSLSNILSLAMIPITSDGYAIIQVRTRHGVSADAGRRTSGVAENIHRYLDDANSDDLMTRLHPLTLPEKLEVDLGVDATYTPVGVPSPFLTAERGVIEELSPGLCHSWRDKGAIKFLSVVFDLDKFHPMLTGVIELGLSRVEAAEIIEAEPGRDHSEYRKLEYIPLDAKRPEFMRSVSEEHLWVSGGLAALAFACQYWDHKD